MSYEILEHTADAKFRATGKTKEEVFSNAIKAFADVVGADPEAGEYRHSIEVEAENLDALLFDLMDELIFLQDTENVAVCHADEVNYRDPDDAAHGRHKLETTVWVDPITRGMSLLDIKGPTYSDMVVDHRDGQWVIEAVLDI